MVGEAYTVTTCVFKHPELFVYVIVDVPAEIPLTTPDEFTVATELFELNQGLVVAGVPLPVSEVVFPVHRLKTPVIVGFEFTAKLCVVLQPPTKYVIITFP